MTDEGELSEELAEEVRRRLGLTVRRSQSIYAGDEAAVWRADARDLPVVVRISPSWRTAAELDWVHDLLAFAATQLEEAVAPLAGAAGETWFLWRGRPVSIFPFVEGAALDREDPHQRGAAARLLARLHLTLREWPGLRPRPPAGPDAPASWPKTEDAPELRDATLDAWHATWRERAPSLPGGPIHGDYYRRNLLCLDGRIAGVIDWDDARFDVWVAEVAWSAWEFGKVDGGERLDARRASQFLDDYASASGRLPPDIDALFVPLIRWRLREEVRHARAAAARGLPRPDGDAEYTRRQLRAFHWLRETRP